MALVLNPLRYPFATRTTALGAATRHDFTAVTLQIPENTTRTFLGVVAKVTCRGTETTGTSMTSVLIGIKLGAVAFNDATVTDTIANTGDQQTFTFYRDVTSYFETNFGSGTSQTCQVGVQFGALGVINVTCELIILYRYDDAGQTTRAKTVQIPMDSTTGALTNTLASIGSNQIPDLSTFLPEASKTIDQIWIRARGNEAATATTDFNLALALDAEAEVQDGSHEQALNTGCYYEYLWVRNDMTTNATHDLKARSTVTGTFLHIAFDLFVTYRYDDSASTSYIQSVVMGIGTEPVIGSTAAGDRSRMQFKFFVEEPATIALVQSAVYLAYSTEGIPANLSVAAGSQTARAYSHTLPSTIAGFFNLQQRIDSGGAAGAGITLARGENTLTLDIHQTSSTTTNQVFGLMAEFVLNYTSGKSSLGSSAHKKTVMWPLFMFDTDILHRDSSAVGFDIPQSNYWIDDVSFLGTTVHLGVADSAFSLQAERLSGEGSSDGWESFGVVPFNLSGEVQVFEPRWCGLSKFKRHPSDPDTKRLDIESARKYRIASATSNYLQCLIVITFHAITFSATRALTQYAGDGSAIDVHVIRPDTFERIYKVVSAAGGGYTVTGYDNTVNLMSIAREDGTHVGASDHYLLS